MRPTLVLVIVTLSVLVGCSRQSEMTTFINDTYGFTITYPAGWTVNKAAKIVPPPPATTSLQAKGLTIAITAWEHPSSASEQASLRQDGWKEEETRVDGVKAISFTRPLSDTRGEMRKKVYVQHNGIAYDITFLVYDNQQYDAGLSVYDSLVKTFKWNR